MDDVGGSPRGLVLAALPPTAGGHRLKRIVDNTVLAIAKLFYRECAICGGTRELHVHHIVFRSQGGDDVDGNLCGLCRTHHDQIHAGEKLAWVALKAYIFFERPDTVLYLEEKFEGDPERFFARRLGYDI
jgi:hypothetical protein